MTAYERETLAVDRVANSIGERANSIAEAQRVYGLLQLALGAFGVVFTGIAAVAAIAAALYAKEAASQAKRSADADNAALTEARAAADDARKEAKAQAKRLTAQLAIAKDTLNATRESIAAADRAWMQVFGSVEGELTIDPSRATIRARFTFENVGKSPAINVLVDCKLVDNFARAHNAITQASRAQTAMHLGAGRIVFPGDRATFDGLLELSLLKTVQQIAKGQYDEDDFALTVIAGVQYALPGDRTVRLSYRYFTIGRKGHDNIGFSVEPMIISQSELEVLDGYFAGPVS